ncbi:MAG: ATP-binding cassette domain-containing protein [Deltaproteobacteria bacterium]|nr:ATP-binding cassette domain-containing protein [Deltaproteobacteria bacterium]
MLYEIKNLVKQYDDRVVLGLPHASLPSGKIIGLLGPNGAGKTTLLEILAFLLAPTLGEVFYQSSKVHHHESNILAFRQKVVLVQQKPILFSTTVFKNIEFPLKIRKQNRIDRKRIIEDLLRLVGMQGFKDAKAHHLSGGETQRIAIAQALACSPEVILMDEPTASVDVENQIIIERIIREINKDKGISVIFTTHDMIQATRVADETMFLYEGRIAESIHENIFSGFIETDETGQKYCVLLNQKKFQVQTDRNGPVRISIKPNLLTIRPVTEHPFESNTYQGRLLQLTHERNRIRALVDMDMPISVLIPPLVFATLSLKLGEEVFLTCPPESFEFL